jgi:hypothetical protein
MKPVWRKHLIICLFLGLLAVPIYFLDRALLGRGGGGRAEQQKEIKALVCFAAGSHYSER